MTIEELEQKILNGEPVTDQQLALVTASAASRGRGTPTNPAEKRLQELSERSKNPNLSPAERLAIGYEKHGLEHPARSKAERGR